ncbi:MafI family immunity protein [Myceligenerans indicum]|uniref:MafI family immunity protein n=1 Tax=Myceligenerans indicum TaxID=2593663 RepID=A0ABS1LSE5_9MICO|nr:MafI family immunity protein [Myceligenerans indicum]MBL0888723.1 MafI family immunity protein [Myceligenerans indicum]
MIEFALRAAVERVAAGLTTDWCEDVFHLIEHGEPGLALDTLCTQLYEFDVVVDDETRRLIAQAGHLMGMNPLLWESLHPAPWPRLDRNVWWILPTGEPDDVEHLVVLRDELRSEIAGGHVLHGEPFDVLARFAAADEVLLRLTSGRFALAHPTWSRREEPLPWPTTEICPDIHAIQAVIDRLEDGYT